MGAMNRRAAVLGVGGLAGLAALPTVGRAAACGRLSATEVLEKIRLAGEAEATFLRRLGQVPTLAVPLPPGPTRPVVHVEAAVVARGVGGGPTIYGLAFACDPRVVNRFTVGGAPLVARRVCFSADEVGWAPGFGFPVYGGFAPRHEYDPAMRYRQAKAHQLVPLIGDGYFAPCRSGDVCEAPAGGPVAFDVNDTHYDDNLGSYTVIVWSWS